MTDALPTLVVGYLGVVTLVALANAFGVPCGRAALAGAGVAEVLLMINAVTDLGRVIAGPRPAELGVHLAYVLVSVAVIPLLLGYAVRTGGAAESRDRWRSVILALACLVAAVVVVRQRATA